jgi:hypothetical protein
MVDNQVLIATISAASGIVATYLTVKYKNQIVKPPKDRVETIFDGYEALIRQQQDEITRKSGLIDRLEDQLATMEQLVDKLRTDLNSSQMQIEGLSSQLTMMKTDYGRLKASDLAQTK